MLSRVARLAPRLRGVRLNSTNPLKKGEPGEAQKQANLNNAKMLGVGAAAVAGAAYYKWGRKPVAKAAE